MKIQFKVTPISPLDEAEAALFWQRLLDQLNALAAEFPGVSIGVPEVKR